MTPGEFQKVAARVDLSGFPIRLRLGVCQAYGGLRLSVDLINVQDREDRSPTIVHHVETLSDYSLGHFTEDSFIEYLWRFAGRAVVHELDEHFLVDGARRFDPHANRGIAP